MRQLLPGAALAAALALAALLAARPLPLDATLLALLLGLAAGAALRHPPALEAGAQATLKAALTAGVVLLGAEVDLGFLAQAGARGLALAAALILLTFVLFLLLARWLRVPGETWALTAAGTGVCGLSAVIATGASLESRKEDVAVAAASVGILSAVGLLAYPLVGLAARMPEAVYGAWSGLSLHAVANAVAAGFALGPEAGRVATVTKLARVALLAPTLLALTLLMRRHARAAGGAKALLPPMVWGFLAASLLVTLVDVPAPALDAVRTVTRWLLVLGIAALGYVTRLGHLRAAGARALALAVLGWLALSAVALAGAFALYG